MASLRWLFQPRRGLGAAMGFAIALAAGIIGRGAEPAVPLTPPGEAGVLTSFEEVWRAADTAGDLRHPVRLEFVVYHYDPLWKAMWGRCGEANSYLSLGNAVFPIQRGQRLSITGFIVPANGMIVEEPHVTVLADSVKIAVLPTRGELGNIERFNKRLVTIEGLVDRQEARDSNHVNVSVLAEGRVVTAQVLLKGDAVAPGLRGAFVRVSGVYFARQEFAGAPPKLELWVQAPEDFEVLGWLERDERFEIPSTPIRDLARMPPNALVRIAGAVRAQQPGSALTIRDDTGELTFATLQTRPVDYGRSVEAIGYPVRDGEGWTLDQPLYRPTQMLLTTIPQIWQVPEPLRQEVHRVRLELDVLYHDPVWRVMWVRNEGLDEYVSVGEVSPPLKPGQRVRLEGLIVPAKGAIIEQPRATPLGPSPPVEIVPVAGRIGETALLNRRVVVVDGYVDRQAQTSPRHVELELVVEDRPVTARLLVDGTFPRVEGALLRVTGVYSATPDPLAQMPKIEIWAQGAENAQVLGRLEDDPRFGRPPTQIEDLAAVAAGAMVRISGVARGQQPGKSLTIRDETGQTIVRTAQSEPVQIGARVEAIGVPRQEGYEWVLEHALYRPGAAEPAAPGDELQPLRLADQLRELAPEEIERSRPVQLTGVVTWSNPRADFLYLRDVSGGVRVLKPADQPEGFELGSRIEVTGVSAAGKFAPVVLATRITKAATVDLPEAKEVTLEQALTGVEEAQWVAMSGFVREMREEGPWVRLELAAAGGGFTALVPPSPRLPDHRGAVVRMRGVCSALANDRRQLTGIQLWVPSRFFIEVEEPAPKDPFAVPARSIASLRQFGSLQAVNRRVRVSGVVLSHVPGRFVHLQEGGEGLLVLSRASTALAPGDRIEAVGFPGRETGRLVLREAVYRRTGRETQPAPLDLGGRMSIAEEIDGRLVRVEAALLQTGAHERGVRLVAQAGGHVFEAVLDAPDSAPPGAWEAGSRVALTGVYEVQFDEYKRAHAVLLRLREPEDVAVLRRPSWWTARRAWTAIGVLTLGVLAGLGWAAALRRRVRQQTAQIRVQFENEKAARLEAALARASKLESLGVLAGGIAHDFNNLLTVVMCNLSLAKLDAGLEAETADCLRESERAASRAKDLTQQLLTFAKGGAPVRTSIMLPDVVRESAAFALHGAKSRCDFDIAPDLWPADVDRGQVGQVVHNIVINANQAMPGGGVITIALRNAEVSVGAVPPLPAGRYVKLAIGDQGTGISAADLPRIFDPYFTTKQQGSGLGLATVYSIVKQHQGHVEVTSAPGAGTTFHVWLPAANHAPLAPAAPTSAVTRLKGRVLFMDDEPPIRVMAAAVFKRMGLEATTVSDGAAVVREYAAARAANRMYDVVILDLTVPGGMGGGEAMEKLREIDPCVRAIVSSGYSSDPVLANYQAYGFCGIVPKPYEVRDLAKAVEAVLSQATAATC